MASVLDEEAFATLARDLRSLMDEATASFLLRRMPQLADRGSAPSTSRAPRMPRLRRPSQGS
eukprot:7870631-Pyramimonas_sp.AAC.1